jgi:hypothetical protein
MKIILDKARLESYACGMSNLTPEELVSRKETDLRQLGEFLGLGENDSIEYIDLGNGEDYVITKGDRSFILQARGNKIDGGFLCFSWSK